MQKKFLDFNKLWHNDAWIAENIPQTEKYDYSSIDSLAIFKDSHPAIMAKRLKDAGWDFVFENKKSIKLPLRKRILNFIYKKSGWHIGEFKNYNLLES